VAIHKQKANRITLVIKIIYLALTPNHKQTCLITNNNLNLLELTVKCSSNKTLDRNRLIKFSIKSSHRSKQTISLLIIQIRIVFNIQGKILPSQEETRSVNKHIMPQVKVFLHLRTPKCIKCNKTSIKWFKTTRRMPKMESGNNNRPKVKTLHSTFIVRPIIHPEEMMLWMMSLSIWG